MNAQLCDAAARGDLQIVELLLGLGANVNGEESETVEKVILERKPSKWDTTTPYEYISREDRPLYIACHNGQREVAEYFLQMGAIVQDEDVRQSRSPTQFVCMAFTNRCSSGASTICRSALLSSPASEI